MRHKFTAVHKQKWKMARSGFFNIISFCISWLGGDYCLIWRLGTAYCKESGVLIGSDFFQLLLGWRMLNNSQDFQCLKQIKIHLLHMSSLTIFKSHLHWNQEIAFMLLYLRLIYWMQQSQHCNEEQGSHIWAQINWIGEFVFLQQSSICWLSCQSPKRPFRHVIN